VNPEWLDIARNDLGNPEALGPNDSTLIRKMLAKLNGVWLKGQPWCGSFIAYVMQQCVIPFPKDYYRAKAWVSWGTACGPVVGAVAVLERVGGGHVTICAAQDANGNIIGLGGNQGDRVKYSPFSPTRIIAYRWPPGRAFYDAKPLPVVASTEALSTNEA
jgi:uncharacterized protein (TIGR02594 family)